MPICSYHRLNILWILSWSYIFFQRQSPLMYILRREEGRVKSQKEKGEGEKQFKMHMTIRWKSWINMYKHREWHQWIQNVYEDRNEEPHMSCVCVYIKQNLPSHCEIHSNVATFGVWFSVPETIGLCVRFQRLVNCAINETHSTVLM